MNMKIPAKLSQEQIDRTFDRYKINGRLPAERIWIFAQEICAARDVQWEPILLNYHNALWKACGDDGEYVESYLESQR